jgi:hypothetical protein
MLSPQDLVATVVAGCPTWGAISMLDDDVDFKTQDIVFADGDVLTLNAVFDTVGGRVRLASVCLTWNALWGIDYCFEGTATTARAFQYDPQGRWMRGLGVLGACLPPAPPSPMVSRVQWARTTLLHTHVFKLQLVASCIPALR